MTKNRVEPAITLAEANRLIDGTNGRFFSVTFLKTNGKLREMTCRLGVKKDLRGGTLKYDPRERGLRVVHEAESIQTDGGQRMTVKSGYKMIPTGPRLLSLRVGGKAYGILPPVEEPVTI